MKRRDFITLVGGAAAAWPLGAQAQQPVIGFLSSASPGTLQPQLAAFRKALGDAGFIEDRNVRIEYRWADGQYNRLPAMAADLVSRRVALILSTGGADVALAAKAATSTIPIVMIVGVDPVKTGLVTSFNRPGGNITGATLFAQLIESKRLGLLHEAVPTAKTIAVLVNPATVAVEFQLRDMREAAPRIGVELVIFSASSESEFEGVFATIVRRQAGGLLVGTDPYFNSRRVRLIGLAARHRLPAIYGWREYALDGGLMSYGTVLADGYSQAGTYAGRVLKGEKPGDLPVVQPTKFEFVINLKTAKQLGLTFSPSLLARADEAIE